MRYTILHPKRMTHTMQTTIDIYASSKERKISTTPIHKNVIKKSAVSCDLQQKTENFNTKP